MSNFVPKITRWVSQGWADSDCPESRKTLIFQGFLGHHKNFLHLFDTIRRPRSYCDPERNPPHPPHPRGRPVTDNMETVADFLLRYGRFSQTQRVVIVHSHEYECNYHSYPQGYFEGRMWQISVEINVPLW